MDDKCGFFKHFERKRTNVVGSELERQLPHYQAYSTQTVSYDDYLAEFAKLRSEGQAAAATIDCESQKAGEFLLPLRNAVSVEIYSDLMIASEAKALGPDQQQAAQEWWDASEIFYGERVEEPCLGAPCFALPPETLSAILSGSPNQAYRFFLARGADVGARHDRNPHGLYLSFVDATGFSGRTATLVRHGAPCPRHAGRVIWAGKEPPDVHCPHHRQ